MFSRTGGVLQYRVHAHGWDHAVDTGGGVPGADVRGPGHEAGLPGQHTQLLLLRDAHGVTGRPHHRHQHVHQTQVKGTGRRYTSMLQYWF